MKYILLDIGSSTVKPYSYDDGILNPLIPITVNFKKIDFEKEALGLLLTLINNIKKEYPEYLIKTYATSIFRKQSESFKIKLIDQLFAKTGVYLNIISQDLESFYLEKALLGRFKFDKNVLLVNIGEGSTELVTVSQDGVKKTFNIDLGVGTINTKYKGVNDEFSIVSKDEVISYVKSLLPPLEFPCEIAFYTGGELGYMQLAGYKLNNNDIFTDVEHPSFLHLADFKNRNKDIFSKISLSNLQSLMPENPAWMLGARSCSAIAEAIFEKYKVQKIIPSNTNIIHGVIQQEYRAVTISGSFSKNLKSIKKIKRGFEKANIQVISPKSTICSKVENGFVYLKGDKGIPWILERNHLNAINSSDALIVSNKGGYLGSSSLMELGYALAKGIKIVFQEKPLDVIFESLPAETGLFNIPMH